VSAPTRTQMDHHQRGAVPGTDRGRTILGKLSGDVDLNQALPGALHTHTLAQPSGTSGTPPWCHQHPLTACIPLALQDAGAD